MSAYREYVKEMAAYVRNELQEIEDISSLQFDIDISGRLHDGELKIEFKLGSSYGVGGQVKGGDLEAIVREYKRRFGWDQRNKPLELSFAPEKVDEVTFPQDDPNFPKAQSIQAIQTDDEIPF